MVLFLRAPEDFDRNDLDARKKLIADYCKYLVNNNRHLIMAIIGKPGRGKSYAAMDLANVISNRTRKTDFDVNEYCVLGAMDFFKVANKALPGQPIIFDEIGAQTGFNSRKSMSSENIALSSMFQTIRSRRLIIIITTPNFSNIDVSLRKLVDIYLVASNIDYKTKKCELQFTQIQVNDKSGKAYYHHIRIHIKNRGMFLMRSIFTDMPPKEMYQAYEKMKFDYQEKLNQIIQGQLARLEDKERGLDVLNARELEVFKLYETKMPLSEVYKRVGVSSTTGSKLINTACAKMGVPLRYYNIKGDASRFQAKKKNEPQLNTPKAIF